MKKAIIVVLFLFFFISVNAAEQKPDILDYGGIHYMREQDGDTHRHLDCIAINR